jgi:Ca-activated chloride channel family protein
MKLATLSALCFAGMLLTSISVYSLTPPGGIAIAAPSSPALSTTPEATAVAVATAAPTAEGPSFTAGTTLSIDGALGHKAWLRGRSGETFVLLEVRGQSAGRATVRANANLAIVIDRSGSMKGRRIQNAILAASAAVDRLHDSDVVSVVTFDTATQVVVPPTVINAGARASIEAGIRSIALGGDTCISCGIEQGMDLLEKNTGRVSRMIVLSDGDANAGIRDVPGFRSLAQRARDRGISVTTVGVNVDYNERILGAIAEESNGQHYFVEDEGALARAFTEEADALTNTLASGAEVAIDLAPGVTLSRVLDRSFRRVDRRIVVPLGAFTKGEVKTVLLKLQVSAESDGSVASVDLTYRDMVSGEPARAGGVLRARFTDDAREAGEIEPAVFARAQRSETAAALAEANQLFSQGRVQDARRKLDAEVQRIGAVAVDAAKAPPSPRAGDASRDLQRQGEFLDSARRRFTPPASGAVAPAQPFEASESGKGAVRENNKNSFDLRR